MKHLLVALIASINALAAPTVLYDATTGQTPGNSGWFAFFPGATESMGPGYVDFSTSALPALQGGYQRFLAFGDAFRLRIDVGIVSETHLNANRAGFSVIALDQFSRGVELSFWEDEVWIQNTGFTHGEGVAFDTTSGINRYELYFGGGSYWLAINGVGQLSGNIQDYSGFGFPYDLPNFLFIGDDTTSGSARIRLSYAEFANVPEPAALPLAGLGLLLLLVGRVRRSRG